MALFRASSCSARRPQGPQLACTLPNNNNNKLTHARPLPTPPPIAAKGGARRADYLPMAQEVWWKKDDDGVSGLL